MAKYDPLHNQCKVLYGTAKVHTSNPFPAAGQIKVLYKPDDDSPELEYTVPFKYHCPGGDEAINGSEAFAPNDVVVVECNENNVPQRVVGHYDGAERCNIVYAVAWFDSNYINFKWNDTNRWFNCWDAVRDKYYEYGIVSHFNGFAGTVSIQYADGYPYRCVICLELMPAYLGDLAGYYLLGRYCFIDVIIDPDDNYSMTHEVYFYGLYKLYDDYPYWETFQNYGCTGQSKPLEAEDGSLDGDCGIAYACYGSKSYNCECTCTQKVAGFYTEGHYCPCDCTEADCCWTKDDYCTNAGCGWSPLFGCYGPEGYSGCCCLQEVCAQSPGETTCSQNVDCENCETEPLPVGTYATANETEMPKCILAGARYYANTDTTYGIYVGVDCGEAVCCPDGCGTPSCIVDTQHKDILACVFQLTRDFGVWEKDIDEVAADPAWNGLSDIGSPSSTISTDPADSWYTYLWPGSAPDGCTRGRSYRYQFIPQKMIGDGKWIYRYVRTVVEDLEDPPGCECTDTDIDSQDNVLVGFTYNFPGIPDGEDEDSGDWKILQNMLKGSLESYVISWVYGSSMDHFRSTSLLGENLPLVSGLAAPLDYPDRTGVLISDINNSGFTISTYGGKVRAYSGFETVVQDEVTKVQPVGEHLYEWTVGFANPNVLQRNICLMVYQPPT